MPDLPFIQVGSSVTGPNNASHAVKESHEHPSKCFMLPPAHDAPWRPDAKEIRVPTLLRAVQKKEFQKVYLAWQVCHSRL